MQILINIVGLRYYALGDNRWQQLFTPDGGIASGVSGARLVLRRSCESAVDCAVEAIAGGERWGNVADSEKLVLAAYMQSRGIDHITTTIVSGDRDMRGLQVKADIDPPAAVASCSDGGPYARWMDAAAAFPTLMPTEGEQQFSTTLASLHAATDGGQWNHRLFLRLRPLIGIDLSAEAMRSLRGLAMKARAIGGPDAAADAHTLECDIIHLGSTESRTAWLAHWLAQLDTPQVSTLRALAAHCDAAALEPLLLSFPGDVFALLAANPVLAVARLHYARLPRATVRKFLSLWLLWEWRRREADNKEGGEGGCTPDRPGQLTAQQVAIFAYYLLDNQGTLNYLSRQTIADFFALLTGYKARTLKQRLDFQSRFDTPRVRSDIARIASLLRTIMPTIYNKIQNEFDAS